MSHYSSNCQLLIDPRNDDVLFFLTMTITRIKKGFNCIPCHIMNGRFYNIRLPLKRSRVDGHIGTDTSILLSLLAQTLSCSFAQYSFTLEIQSYEVSVSFSMLNLLSFHRFRLGFIVIFLNLYLIKKHACSCF